MSENIATTSKALFDRKFVFAAIFIGLVYTAIVVILVNTIGKEAAGIAGVALTALATAIFKQFETLRFRQLADDQSVIIEVPKFSFWYFILVVCAFVGIQVIIGLILGPLVILLGLMKPGIFGGMIIPPGAEIKLMILAVGSTIVALLFAGFVVGKTAPSVTYMYAFLAALLSNLVILPFLLGSPLKYIFIALAVWVLYIVAAFVGARLGFRHRNIILVPGTIDHASSDT